MKTKNEKNAKSSNSESQIPQINLEFDADNFPQLVQRYSADELRDVLINMCEKQKLPLTEKHLYSCAACLETDLEEMFP